jgi:hypothetical protein
MSTNIYCVSNRLLCYRASSQTYSPTFQPYVDNTIGIMICGICARSILGRVHRLSAAYVDYSVDVLLNSVLTDFVL